MPHPYPQVRRKLQPHPWSHRRDPWPVSASRGGSLAIYPFDLPTHTSRPVPTSPRYCSHRRPVPFVILQLRPDNSVFLHTLAPERYVPEETSGLTPVPVEPP